MPANCCTPVRGRRSSNDARNSRAAARGAGDRELAALIAALRKPSAAAHLVNLLAHAHDEALTELIDLGASIRGAFEQGDDVEMRELLQRRAGAIADTVAHARAMARSAGDSMSPAVAEQVTQTLRAAMASAEVAEEVRRGTLTDSLDDPGFTALGVAPPPRRRTPKPSAASRKAGRPGRSSRGRGRHRGRNGRRRARGAGRGCPRRRTARGRDRGRRRRSKPQSGSSQPRRAVAPRSSGNGTVSWRSWPRSTTSSPRHEAPSRARERARVEAAAALDEAASRARRLSGRASTVAAGPRPHRSVGDPPSPRRRSTTTSMSAARSTGRSSSGHQRAG